jgi:integrase
MFDNIHLSDTKKVFKMARDLSGFEVVNALAKKYPKGVTPVFGYDVDENYNGAEQVDFLNGPYYLIDETDNDYGLKADTFINENIPENTRRAYHGDIQYFSYWICCIFPNKLNVKITEEIILQFIFHHLDEMPSAIEEAMIKSGWKRIRGQHSLATVKRRLTSVSIFHKFANLEDPCNTPKVKTLLATFARTAGTQKKAKAITLHVLDKLLETCKTGSLKDIRDKALLLFGFSTGGRRRSEIADADLKDLEEAGDDFVFKLVKSKTDQEGKGKDKPVKGRAATALKEWITASGIKEGKIFRSVKKGGLKLGDSLTTVDINRIVKKRCGLAGYDESSGFITESGKQNKPLGDTMELSGHSSVPTALSYFQAGNVLNNQASNLAG